MTYASHLLRHSKKLRNAPDLLQTDPVILVRWFSKAACPSTNSRDDLLRNYQQGYLPVKKDGSFYSSIGGTPSTISRFNYSCIADCPDFSKSPFVGEHKGKLSRTMKMDIPVVGTVFNKGFSGSQACRRRSFSTASELPPHQELGMPSLSPTMTEGNIARWLKKEGDKVSPGEVLCEVETDKATVEMECMEEGYIAKIIHGDGSKEIKVGEVIAITVEEEGDIAKFKDYKPSKSGDAEVVKKPADSAPPKKEVVEEPLESSGPKISKTSGTPPAEDRIFASPLARKMAEDHNIPLSSIKGTGPDGRIVKADIEDYLASSGKDFPAPVSKTKDTAVAETMDYTDLPHSQIRKVTASRLLLSKQTIPHYYLTVDTCVDKLMDLRSQLNSLQEASGGKRISVNDLVIKAAALALRKVPQCNSSWNNDYIRQYHNVNINVAVQTDNGLYVPVIRDADKKGLSKIAEEVKHLAQKAKENNLKPEDYEGGTFTVSNLGGPFGIKQFCAIINPPQSGILAVGSAERRVVPGNGPEQFKFASFMSVTLSCDHRVIDGAIGAEWLKAFKGYIENPESMLL
ncbi:PREDICTED: dihydrolipoyllysine-residue acetyltransferase component 2 of pyruvate dehydrogenase complex, mitochondrial-like [Nelumbo nucifera]|uniref:Acetyltransferase component of pyruvate dehydrogenase complex n=1 Tax=Nelumbo nucifera TaxID=4432 RepID=A0A1U7Z4K2_NELNU|nr:PREDICTED: dihydrolipoyllysine-residue acetyltransferase component 2 of pyruvate dehydrogenase complex, mitochondrial-like [Nelumbo nucifera]XP_010242280.1 PREDICTED: dihydrolipoyllysine-residue acetyltransferase component 2 of pyruvate dehydrogenase complex, mitochondrial-like [Nelumbo nucifera]